MGRAGTVDAPLIRFLVRPAHEAVQPQTRALDQLKQGAKAATRELMNSFEYNETGSGRIRSDVRGTAAAV